MANHAHRQIREAVATALTGLTSTGSRVYPNRLYPIADGDLPALRVFVDNEESNAQSIHQPYLQERTLRLQVEGCAKANAALDSTLDQISKEVETALAADLVIGSVRLAPIYTGSEYDDQISEKPVAVKRLSFDIVFYVNSNAPDVLL